MQMFEAAADAQAAPKVSFPAPTNQ
jgi:hypothetical protein